MLNEAYSHLNHHDHEIDQYSSDNPLIIPDETNSFWRTIQSQLLDLVKSSDDLKVMYSPENPYLLMSGAVNLINYIIESKNSDPIETIVFLDKSSRPAAFIFRKLWIKLDKQGKLPKDLEIPKIRFINIGQENKNKHNLNRALRVSSETFKEEDFRGKGVLVVDEIVATGGSLRRAMRYLSEVYNSDSRGIANFNGLPEWYYYDSFKGVEEPDLNFIVYDFIENLEEDTFRLLESFFEDNFSKDFIIDFFNDINALSLYAFLNKYRNQKGLSFSDDDLTKLYSISYPIEPDILWRYFKSKGGFFALRPSSSDLKKHREYRNYLTKIVDLSSDRIVNAGKFSPQRLLYNIRKHMTGE